MRASDWLVVALLAYLLNLPTVVFLALVMGWIYFSVAVLNALHQWRLERAAERHLAQARAFRPRGDR